MADVRTRFAPSPTGFLHLGSARTALFNWAFARGRGGTFLVRIEDTDRERSTRESEEALLAGLAWLGLEADEAPVRQSERAERHAAAIDGLLASGAAYRCVCTREELEARKRATIEAGGKWTYDGRCREADHGPDCGEHTVRLRLPAGRVYRWDDAVFGPSGQAASEIGDRIIRRSDGGALYHLAVVVDDVDMAVSHVIRGVDHHINTAFQLALYEALDTVPPVFAHTPLIVGPGGKKLSKRREAVAVEHFAEQGYLPEALCNWLVRLGWSHGDDEVFSPADIVQRFDLDGVGRSPASADPAKLDHLNQHWIKALPADDLWRRVAPALEAVAGHAVERSPSLDRLLDLLRERSRTLVEMAERARFAVTDTFPFEEKAVARHLTAAARAPLADLHDRLAALERWDEEALEAAFAAVCEAHGLGLGKLAQPVRVAVTGTATSPGIFETLAILGHERSVGRIAEALHTIQHGA